MEGLQRCWKRYAVIRLWLNCTFTAACEQLLESYFDSSLAVTHQRFMLDLQREELDRMCGEACDTLDMSQWTTDYNFHINLRIGTLLGYHDLFSSFSHFNLFKCMDHWPSVNITRRLLIKFRHGKLRMDNRFIYQLDEAKAWWHYY